jgi:hypothetical protein
VWVMLPIGWSRVVDKDLAVGGAGEVVVSALVTFVIEEASAQAIEILKIWRSVGEATALPLACGPSGNKNRVTEMMVGP